MAVEGTVVDGDGFAVEGAVVTCLEAEGLSDVNGDFFVVDIATTKGPFACRAVFDPIVDEPIFGLSIGVAPIPAGVFDVGTIELRAWTLFGAAHPSGEAPSSLYAIDAETGAASLVGAIGFNAVSGMDFDRIGETLYATGFRDVFDIDDNDVLLTIDPATGAGTEIGRTNLIDFYFGNKVPDMSFRNADGVLYAYVRRGSVLTTLDIATGDREVIGLSLDFFTGGNAMAFSPDDTLYLIWSDFTTATLVTLDPGNGRPVTLGELSLPIANPVGPRIGAADFHPVTGELYGLLRGVVANNDSFLVTIDIETRDVTIIGQSIDGLDALAWVRD